MMMSKAFAIGLFLAATVSIASAAEDYVGSSGGDADKSCEEEFGEDFCSKLGPLAALYASAIVVFVLLAIICLSVPCIVFGVAWSGPARITALLAVIRQSNHLLTVPEYFVARAQSSDSVVSSGAPASPTSRSWSVHANAVMMPASLCQALTNVACYRYHQGRSPTGVAWASCCGIFWVGGVLLNLVIPLAYIIFSFVMIIPFCMDSCYTQPVGGYLQAPQQYAQVAPQYAQQPQPGMQPAYAAQPVQADAKGF